MDIFSVLFDVLIIAVFVAAWKHGFLPGNRLLPNAKERVLCCMVAAVCAGGVLVVLLKYSDSDVRDDLGEVAFYLVFSLLAILLAQELFEMLGVSLRDDGIERRNRGALFAAAGFTFGATCCIAASNIGNGPGGEVVLFCAVLSTGTLLTLWGLLARASNLADAVTVERDAGAGLRTGGLLASCGAICGASVAGDWVSLGATLRDFIRFAWPAFVAVALAIPLERGLNRRPLSERLSPATSGLVAATMVIAAAWYALWVVKQ